jgi:radical S-adenosyl methionine domain-containing protein 2
MIPTAVNFHLYKPCDAACTFCFATFANVRGQLAFDDARRLVAELWRHGAEKITFAGGEPTLYPRLGELLEYARADGFVTGVVTNGSRLSELLDEYADALHWAALSVDSADEAVQARLGRGRGQHVARALGLAQECRDAGVRLKLNTVVTALTWQEDMSELVRTMAPERWKVFQVLRVEGQNDGRVEPLLITDAQFQAFVERHRDVGVDGMQAVVENNDAMTDSYVMVDPLGRFFGNTGGVQTYSQPILEVGVQAALAQVGYRTEKFIARGGRYAW